MWGEEIYQWIKDREELEKETPGTVTAEEISQQINAALSEVIFYFILFYFIFIYHITYLITSKILVANKVNSIKFGKHKRYYNITKKK